MGVCHVFEIVQMVPNRATYHKYIETDRQTDRQAGRLPGRSLKSTEYLEPLKLA